MSVPSVETLAERAVAPLEASHALRIRGPRSSAMVRAKEETPSRFPRALLGSTIGVGLSLGTLLAVSGADWDERHENEYYDDGDQLRAQGLAVLIVLGSAPVGAAIGSGLADEDLLGETVFMGVLGELVVGGTVALAGAGITSWAGGTDRTQNIAAAVGMSVGAAVGAALGATLVGRDQASGLSVRDGQWQVSVPNVSLRPVLHDRLSVGVHVPLVNARF